ncbi:hypothetical protein BVRB_7g157870 [Beta vulgaris subsp. vulgaris]|nr:hypothetical protein BVRB_7g157870 [Beta vulgaris subsp. vulgaris]
MPTHEKGVDGRIGLSGVPVQAPVHHHNRRGPGHCRGLGRSPRLLGPCMDP